MGLREAVIAFMENIKKSQGKPEAVAYNKDAQFAQFMGNFLTNEKGLKKPTNISFTTLRRMSRANSVIRACVNTLKHEVTSVEWHICSKDPKKPLDEAKAERLETLLSTPNANKETFRTLLDKVMEDLLTLDAGCIEKVRNGKGEIAELYYVDGGTIRPCYDLHGQLGDPAYVQYFESGKQGVSIGSDFSRSPLAEFKNEDLIYMMANPQADVLSFGYGLSPVESIIMVGTNALAADQYNGKFFEDDSIPNAIISLGANTTKEQVDQFREFWRSEFTGKEHKIPIIGGIDEVKLTQYKQSQTDMQFMEYTQWLATITVAAFGMSPQDIGLDLKMYQSAAGTQQNLSKSQGIKTYLTVLKEYINQEIIWTEWNGEFKDVMFDWKEIDKIDEKTQAETDKIEIAMGIKTINEARKERGLDPIKGGVKPYILAGQMVNYIDATPLEDISDAEVKELMVQEEPEELNEGQIQGKEGSLLDNKAVKPNAAGGANKTNPKDSVKKAYTDTEKLWHPNAGEVPYLVHGEGVTENQARLATRMFNLAAEMAFQGKSEEIITKLNLRHHTDKGVLKSAIDYIVERIPQEPNESYAVITNWVEDIARRPKAVYSVYCNGGAIVKGLKKKPTNVSVPNTKEKSLQLSNALTKHIQAQLKKQYPKLVASIKKSTQEFEGEEYGDTSDLWDDNGEGAKSLELEPSFWEGIFLVGAGTMLGLLTPEQKKLVEKITTFTYRNRGMIKERAKAVSRTASRTLHKDIKDFLDKNQNLSYDDQAKGIKDILGWEDEWRARRIALTETRWSFNQGRMKLAEEAGIREFVVAPGPMPCEICEGLTNNFRRVYKASEIDGLVPFHPNCYCIVEIND